jgi:sporulation protein YlmC with PRC-barrel domain
MKTSNSLASCALTLAIATMAATVAAQEAREPRVAAATPQRTSETTLAEWLVDKDARVSELVGKRVINRSGTDLGEVEDLLASPGRDQTPVVVLSIGGVLDIGDKWYATSLEQLRIADDNERLVLDKTEADLKAAPEFDYVPTHGEQSPLPGVSGPNTTSSIGRLIGATVVDDEDESIGEIKDFVVSTGKEGTRAVVGLDDDAGKNVDGRLVAIPLDDLHIEFSAEEAAAVPLQARVRVELRGTPVEALPAYEYRPDPIERL